jgi:hypothetical protein
VDDLHVVVPPCVRELAGMSPVTLFVQDPSGSGYVSVSSTIQPTPMERVNVADPLVREFRRSRRPLFLAGRPDDLEYIPIFVENGAQLRACEAACAVPLEVEGDLLGFLLCGRPTNPDETSFEKLPLLEFLSHGIAARLEILLLRAQLIGPPRSGAPLDTPGARS